MANTKDAKNHQNEARSAENPKRIKAENFNYEEDKKTFWITRAIAEDIGREEILRTTFIETIVYAFFVCIVTIYAMEVRSQAWFFLTRGLLKQFVETQFKTINNAEIMYGDIRTVSDFWSYAENHLIGSLFWESTYGDQHLVSENNKNSMNILYENKVLGVPRMRQVKVTNDSCIIHKYFRRLFLTCFGAYSDTAEDKLPFGPKTETAWVYSDKSVTKSLPRTRRLSSYGGGGFYVDFSPKENATRKLIRELKEKLWIRRGTRALFIDFSIYNVNLNIFCICTLIFEFPTSGGIIPSSTFNVVRLISFERAYDLFVIVCEYGMYLFVAFYIAEELREFAYFKSRYFAMFWSYVDISIIMCTIINGILTLIRRLNVGSAIDNITNNPDKYGNLEFFAEIQIESNNIFAINVFLIYVKIFKYLNFNRTMGQLNNTLRKCAMDILGFSIMFFIIFFAFAELGYLLFGDQVENFSSFGIAMFTLLRTILGDFNYNEIEQASRILAPIYFLSYIFLVFFVLLNMFLAIINDTYADVKTEIAIAPDEMQMTEYLSRGFRRLMRRLGYGRGRKSEMKRELNMTIRQIREALKKCGFSDLEIEMFFARYNIDPLAEVGEYDVQKLLAELEGILGEDEHQDGIVHISDFIRQQERLQQIDKTIGILAEQVKALLIKLDTMENVKKIKK